jgi:hypothetical protein
MVKENAGKFQLLMFFDSMFFDEVTLIIQVRDFRKRQALLLVTKCSVELLCQ